MLEMEMFSFGQCTLYGIVRSSIFYHMVTTGKMAIALTIIIAVCLHVIPQFKANELRHTFVLHMTYFLNNIWFASCSNGSKVKYFRRH